MTANLVPVTADGGFLQTPVAGEPAIKLATEEFVETAIANLVDTAPDTLNTLNELSAALNDDANFASTIATTLGNKADTASLSAVATSGSYDDLLDKPTTGGSSFDQTLNTTDDVAFDSALVGDVSIAGNTIGTEDSDTLVVDSNLNVTFGELITSAPQTIYAWAYGSSGSYFSIVSPGNEFRINVPGYVQPNADVSAFVSGATVTMPVPNVGTYILVLTSNMVWNGQYWTASCTVISGGSVPNELRLYGYEGPVTVTSVIDTRVNALEVTEAGVNINGALTVNGDPVVINLSQITEDILPSFTEVYDIGSTSKRFYDAFIANNIDINGAQLTGSVSGLATTGNITADGLISDSVVTTSMLAGDVLISDNIITPDNAVPSEYSGSNLGELVVNGNLTVSGDWLNVPVVETVTETTQTEVVTENTLYTTIDIRPYPMGLAYVLSLTRTGPSTAIIDIDLGSNTYSNYLDITDKLIPWLQSRPTNIQFRVDTNGFGELESIIVIAVVAVTVLQSNYSSSLTRFRIECEAINTTTGVANLSLLKFADVPYTGTTTEIVTETTVVSEPSTAGVEGFIRFNKDTAGFEGHNGTEWGDISPVDLTGYATETYVGTAVNNLIDAAPGALNTLNELAAALNDDANFASTVITSLSTKQATLVSGTNIKTVNGATILGSGDIVDDVRSSISYSDGSTTLTAVIDYPNGVGFLAVKDGAGFQYLSGGGSTSGWPDLDVHADFWNQPIGTVFTLTSLRDVYNNTTPGSFTFTTTTAPNGELYYGVFSAGLPIGYYNPASVTYGGTPSPFGYNSATGVLEYDTEFYSSNPLTASELTFPDSTVQTTAYTGPELTSNESSDKTLTAGPAPFNFNSFASATPDGSPGTYTLRFDPGAYSPDTITSLPVGTVITVVTGTMITPGDTFTTTSIFTFVPGSGYQATVNYIGSGWGPDPQIGSVNIAPPQADYVFSADGILTLPTDGAVSYTPSTAGDWAGTPPTTIGEAIDRLAALVKTLNSGTGA